MVIRPLTDWAFSRSTTPRATARSPDTELKLIEPPSPCASIAPVAVLASMEPVTPSRVTSPEAVLTETRPDMPVTMAFAVTRLRVTGQSSGTVTVIAARPLGVLQPAGGRPPRRCSSG